MAAEYGGEVDGSIDGGDDLQMGGDLAGGRGDVSLRGGDDHVLPALLAAAALVEHTQGFADARRVAQEDFETAPAFTALLRLHAAEQFVGIEPAIGSAGHCD